MASWRDIKPADAVNITLPHEGMVGPMNELGERCPWPWDPQQLGGQPLGQYHCPYCGGMQVAGLEHIDWTDEELDWLRAGTAESAEGDPGDHTSDT